MRSEADSKPAKEQETLFCRGEDQQEGSGEERIYNTYSCKGEDHCEVLPVFIIVSHQSASGNDQLSPVPAHLWQEKREALRGRCQAGVLHASRKDPFIMEMTLNL